MKKAVLLFALILIALVTKAQQFPTNPETGRITYTEVVLAEGATQKQLHDKALAWVATTFNSGPSVLQLDTEDKIVIKGIANYFTATIAGSAPSKLHFMMTIDFKEGRYKYETTNFSDNGTTPIESSLLNPKVIYTKDGNIRPFGRNMVEGIRTGITDLNGSLKKAMANKKSDW